MLRLKSKEVGKIGSYHALRGRKACEKLVSLNVYLARKSTLLRFETLSMLIDHASMAAKMCDGKFCRKTERFV